MDEFDVITCPKCGSINTEDIEYEKYFICICEDCGEEFTILKNNNG